MRAVDAAEAVTTVDAAPGSWCSMTAKMFIRAPVSVMVSTKHAVSRATLGYIDPQRQDHKVLLAYAASHGAVPY